MISDRVAVVLNVFSRPQNLGLQIEALKAQTIIPEAIFVWSNGYAPLDSNVLGVDYCSLASANHGVWARFAYALNVESPFVLVLDDDTIPGSKWIQNCLETMAISEGLLGTRGLKFRSRNSYYPNIEVGWQTQNEKIEEVDIVGHSWFFRREWLSAFWAEIPIGHYDRLVGEDIHFSYAIQKVLGLKTFVPPHPHHDVELWGSIPSRSAAVGTDENAISVRTDAAKRFNLAYRSYIARGFRLLSDQPESRRTPIFPTVSLAENVPLRNFLRKVPWLRNLSRKAYFGLLRRVGGH